MRDIKVQRAAARNKSVHLFYAHEEKRDEVSIALRAIARPIARAPSRRQRSGAVVRAAAATAPAPGCTRVKIDELKSTCSNAIMGQGYDAEETRAITDVLMYAQLRGNNQGIIKVTTNGLARAADAVPMKVDTETALSAHIDGGKQQGMLVLNKATEMALEKAKANGFGIAGTCNTSTSTGALGYYCKKIADEGLIAIAMAQSPEFVAPTGSKQAIFGTNPIGVGIPSSAGRWCSTWRRRRTLGLVCSKRARRGDLFRKARRKIRMA